MNVIAWLEYELAYYDSAVHRFNHYTTRTPSQEKVTVRERWPLSEKLGPVGPEARSASATGWVSAPGSCVEIFVWVHARDRHRSTECKKSAKNFSLLMLRAKSVLVCSFFPSQLGMLCLLCVCKACEMPPARDERDYWTIGWPWADLRSWDSGDRLRGYIVTNMQMNRQISRIII